MWRPVNPQLQNDLARVTTSVWLCEGVMVVGVMRTCMIGPPCLWATVLQAGLRNLRRVPALVDEFQQLIYSPTVHAEADAEQARHVALLRYAGFKELDVRQGRVLLERSI